MPWTRRSPRVLATASLAAVLAALYSLGSPQARSAPEATGGFVESANSTNVRPRLSLAEIQAMLPARGTFTFPAPYNTTAVRLTNASDCSDFYDCVNVPAWQNLSNSTGSNFLYAAIGLDKTNGGVGPSLFRFNKTTGETLNLGPLFEGDDDRAWGTLDGWYFSGTMPTTLYIALDAELQRYNVLTHTTSVVFDIGSTFGNDKEIYHAHSSRDDRVHSFTVRLTNNYVGVGCGVYREDRHQFQYFPAVGILHECQVDSSGQWLVIQEDQDTLGGIDNRIVNLAAEQETVIPDTAGAGAQLDTGFGSMIAIGQAVAPNEMRSWTFGPVAPGPVVYHTLAGQPPSFTTLSFRNARSAGFQQQYACGGAVNRVNGPRANEVVCARLDGSLETLVVAPVMTDLDALGGGPDDDLIKQPWGSLDPTGEYFLWTSNLLGSRMDAFIVRIPAAALVTPPADLTAPAVSITAPADAGTVSGTTSLSASASDSVGVVGVQFRLDGANLGAELTSPPFAWSWDTTTSTDGVHVLTAVARDAAGNFTTSIPAIVTIRNGTGGPLISGVGALGIIERLAFVRWTTDQLADTQIEYGPTVAYGSVTPLNTALVTTHQQLLAGLQPATTYHYRVISKNSLGQAATSADFTFTTVAAPIITGITVSDITGTSASVSWTTDLPSDTLVEYGLTTAYGDATNGEATFVTQHLQGVYDLVPGMTYHFRVYSSTPGGVLSISPDMTFTTLAVPVFSNVAAVPGQTVATITWITNQAASTRVDYGNTTAYGSTTGVDGNLTFVHERLLTGLLPGTTYHYRLFSTNVLGLQGTSLDFTFTTGGTAAPPVLLPGILDDGLSRPPPFAGPFGYNTFAPPNTPNAIYTDPAFGSAVHRLTTDHQADDIYGRNMWWNADGTKYFHIGKVIDTSTGQVTHEVSLGTINGDVGFDPVDPNVYYYYNQDTIHRVVLSTTSSSVTDTVFFQAPAEIQGLGGTVNWFDASGRYFLVRYGPEPSIHLYDRQNMAAGPYAGAVEAVNTVDQNGYVGLSPDGLFVVGYDDLNQRGVSWRIDHGSRTVLAANYFWSLCGDHGNFVSASDGRDYMIVANCQDQPEIWRVDITNNALGLNESEQKALPHNQRLIAWPTWDDGVDFATVARGLFRDWAFLSTSDESDQFDTGTDADGFVSPWRAYKGEIIAVHVLTGEIRRIAHHRSRSTGFDYPNQPRLSVSWGGEFVAWSSNFNVPVSWDVVAVPFALTPPTVTDVMATNITGTGATILWATDQLTTSQVEYGLTSAYGTTTPLDTNQVTQHSRTIGGLSPGTTYHYRVISRNVRGLVTSSNDATFTTVPPPVVSNVIATGITGTAAVVQWDTNQPATARVEYGLTSSYGTLTPNNSTLAIAHSEPLTGLSIGTLYHYRVRSTNSVGLETLSPDLTFTTVAQPIVGGVTSSGITGTSATIGWTSDQATNSQVEYGTTTAYGAMTTLNSALVTSHSQLVNGLATGTLYHYRVRSVNSVGLLTISPDFTFTTVAQPVVSGVSSSSITGTTATIGWTSNQATNSQVEYGTTTAYGTSTALDATLVTSHSQGLSGLTPGTLYHYRVRSANSVGLLTTSADFTLTTVAFPVVSGVSASNIGEFSATIGWTTDQPADTQVEYGTTTAYGLTTTLNAAMVTSHSQGLTGLSNGTLYHYRVKSRNSVGLLATSGDFTFTTLAFPIVTGVSASAITGTSATIGWTTNHAADSQVDYGTTTAYGTSTSLNPAMVTSHSQPLSGLTIGTLYHYRVKSRNASGLLTTSPDFTFSTIGMPVITGVSATGMTNSGATIQWTTDQAADTQVEYGTTTAYGTSTTLNSALVVSHNQGLSGLAGGTLYHYRVKSRNSVGLLTTSGDFTFATTGPTPVTWTSLVNTTVTAGVLRKTSGGAQADAGAVSQQSIPSGIGYVEFTVTEANTTRFIGLSNGNPGVTPNEIAFALGFFSGYVEVQEHGAWKWDTSYTTGDVFRISVANGQIKYAKNGVVFYTSTTTATYPLVVDTSFVTLNGSFSNVVISGIF